MATPSTASEYQAWISDPSNAAYRVLCLSMYDSSGHAITLADRPFVGGINGSTPFDDWIIDLPTWEVRIDDVVAGGAFSAVNPADETWHGYTFKDFFIDIYGGDTRWPFSAFVNLFSGVINDARPMRDVWKFQFRSIAHLLDMPIRAGTLAGKNVCIGKCFNVSPRLINASTLQFEAAGNGYNLLTVRNGGVDITGNATQAATAGTFTLNLSPDREVTADVTNTTTQTVASAASWLCNQAAVTWGGFIGASVARQNSVIGQYITGDETYLDVLEVLARSVNCHLIFTANAVKMAYLDTAATITIGMDDTIDGSIEHVETVTPASVVSVGYKPCWTVQDIGSLAGIAQPNGGQYAASEIVTSLDATAGRVNQPDHRSTALYNYSDAGRELGRLWERRTLQREIWRMDIHSIGGLLQIGQRVDFTGHDDLPFNGANIISMTQRNATITTIEVMT